MQRREKKKGGIGYTCRHEVITEYYNIGYLSTIWAFKKKKKGDQLCNQFLWGDAMYLSVVLFPVQELLLLCP